MILILTSNQNHKPKSHLGLTLPTRPTAYDRLFVADTTYIARYIALFVGGQVRSRGQRRHWVIVGARKDLLFSQIPRITSQGRCLST